MENRVITISREYGSGGRMVGRKLAEKLGIHCYDADLIQRIVDKSGYCQRRRRIRGRGSLLDVPGRPDTGDDYSG